MIILFSANNIFAQETVKQLKKVRLQLKWKHQFQFAGYYAAIEKGYYKDLGLEVELIEAKENEEPVNAVFDGKAEFGVGTSDIVMYKTQKHEPIILAAIFQHSPQVILASKNSGIENIHDLAGKRIMIEPHAADVMTYMTDEGVPPEKCIVFPHSFNVEKLLDGSVDAMTAYLTDEPFILEQNNFPFSVISPLSGGVDFYGDLLFTDKKLIEKNLHLVMDFKKASLKGWKYAMEHESEIASLIYHKYSDRHSKEHLLYEANMMRRFIMSDVVEIGYINPGRWQNIIQIYKKIGLIKEETDLKGMFVEDYQLNGKKFPWEIIIISLIIILLISYWAYKYYLLYQKLKVEIINHHKIQEILRVSEEKYRLITENMKDVVWIIDVNDLKYLYLSPAIKGLLGYEPEELIQKKIGDSYTNAKIHFVMDLINNAEQNFNHDPSRYHLRTLEQIKKNDNKIWTEIVAKYYRNTHNNHLELHGVTRDITERKLYEDKLIEQAKYIDIILESLPYPFFVVDTGDYNVVKANSKAIKGNFINKYKIYTLPEEQRKGKDDNVNCPMNIVKKTKKSVETEVTQPDEYGVERTYEVHTHPVFNDNNEMYQIIEYSIDITDRKLAELELIKLSQAIEQSPASIVITDLNGKIEYINPKFSQVTGFSRIEVLGKNPRFLKSGNLADSFYENMWDTISAGKEWNGLFENRKKNGDLYFESATISPIYDQKGSLSHYLAVKEDITEKKIAQEALKASEEKYRFLTEFASDVIWVLNLNQSKFSYVSPAIYKLRGYTAEEAINQTLEEAIVPESQKVVKEAIRKNLKAFKDNPNIEQSFINHIQQPTKDGRVIWVEVSTQYRYNADNEIEIVGVSRNIDTRKKMEDNLIKSESELKELNATKDKFFSIIAHDLKNPFGSFKSMTHLLHESYQDFEEDELLEFLEIMKNSADNLYALLDNLLEWSRSQRGLIQYYPEEFDLNGLVNSSANLLRALAKEKNITLKNEIQKNTTIKADPILLNTIIRNLVSNAIKFTPDNGKISVSFEDIGGFSRISVTDTGVGMSEEKIEQLFRIDKNVTTLGTNDEKGTGLGLILCKEFVEKHGGNITVESEPGKGSTFNLILPKM